VCFKYMFIRIILVVCFKYFLHIILVPPFVLLLLCLPFMILELLLPSPFHILQVTAWSFFNDNYQHFFVR
jgi:hypothetical protein